MRRTTSKLFLFCKIQRPQIMSVWSPVTVLAYNDSLIGCEFSQLGLTAQKKKTKMVWIWCCQCNYPTLGVRHCEVWKKITIKKNRFFCVCMKVKIKAAITIGLFCPFGMKWQLRQIFARHFFSAAMWNANESMLVVGNSEKRIFSLNTRQTLWIAVWHWKIGILIDWISSISCS